MSGVYVVGLYIWVGLYEHQQLAPQPPWIIAIRWVVKTAEELYKLSLTDSVDVQKTVLDFFTSLKLQENETILFALSQNLFFNFQIEVNSFKFDNLVCTIL